MDNAFWNNYVYLCDSVGSSPNGVAKKLGIRSSGTVTGWRNGALPRDSALISIANFFGISVADLLSPEFLKPINETKPTTVSSGELSDQLTMLIKMLTPEERAKVTAYINGMIDNRGSGL